MKKSNLLFVLFVLTSISIFSQNEFITTWKTDNSGSSGDNQITIPVNSSDYTYDYNVDWGDGTQTTNATTNVTHTYSSAGTYTVKITGTFPQIYFFGATDSRKLLTIEQWGTNAWLDFEYSFEDCDNLVIQSGAGIPDLSSCTDLTYAFSSSVNFNSDISNWDVSTITKMTGLFYDCPAYNQPLNSWNVSNVTLMNEMFYEASNFNQGLNNWDVSNVTRMDYMFADTNEFNKDISNWNTSKVTRIDYMFSSAAKFNQNINSWDTSKVTRMDGMFSSAGAFNQNLENWDITSLTNASNMFNNVTLSTANYDALIAGWFTDSSPLPDDGIDDIPLSLTFSAGNSTYCDALFFRNLATDSTPVGGYGWTITDGNQDSNCSFTATFWNGNTNSDWNTASNWSNGVPNSTVYAAIPDTSNAPVISSSTGATAKAIMSNTETDGITISEGGSFIVTDGALGTINFTRTIPTTNWYSISCPFVGQDIDAFVTASNLASGTGNNRGLGSYNNSTKNWSYYQSGATGTGKFPSGSGRIIKLASTGSLAFTGNMPNANYTKIYLTDNTPTGNAYNFVGNPYPSYVSANDLLNANNSGDNDILTESTIWVWDQSEDKYDQFNLASNFYIAPTQGFFVKSDGNQTSFSITKTMLSHQSSDTFQRKGSSRPEIKLVVNDGTQTRDTDIYYINGKTTGFDQGYDSTIFDGDTNKFNLYTSLVSGSNGEKLGIQSLPDSNYEDMIIPVGLISEPGLITFSANTSNLPNGIRVFIEDRFNNTYTRLDDGSTYQVTLNNSSSSSDRFFLHTKSNVLSTEGLELSRIKIYLTSKNSLKISGIESGLTKLNIYNLLGKEVFKTTFNGNNENDVHLPGLINGIYILKIDSYKGIMTKKLLIK